MDRRRQTEVGGSAHNTLVHSLHHSLPKCSTPLSSPFLQASLPHLAVSATPSLPSIRIASQPVGHCSLEQLTTERKTLASLPPTLLRGVHASEPKPHAGGIWTMSEYGYSIVYLKCTGIYILYLNSLLYFNVWFYCTVK